MITAHDLELRAGARILLEPTTLRVQPGDRIGLVGRNGAGKTTTLRIFAGETLPHGGRIERTGPVGYLPQDPRTGDLHVLARDRVLSARGLDTLVTDIAKAQVQLAERPDDDALLRRYGSLEERFTALGGYAAESEAARICANLGLPDRVLAQPLETLSGGQRRRVELARILFADSGAEPTTLLLDEPTNHLDADSIVWLRDFLRQHTGGLVLISHDVGLLDAVVNKVWYLDANRARRRRLQRRLEDLPASSARPTSGAGTASAPTPSARSSRCAARPTRCGPRRRRPVPPSRCCAVPTRWPAGWTRCGCTTRSPGCGSRRRRRAGARR